MYIKSYANALQNILQKKTESIINTLEKLSLLLFKWFKINVKVMKVHSIKSYLPLSFSESSVVATDAGREKFPNTEFLLVRIFPQSDCYHCSIVIDAVVQYQMLMENINR